MTSMDSWARRFALGLLVSVSMLGGCRQDVKVEVIAGIDACRNCNMVIDQLGQSCGFVSEGAFIPFDSPGCLLTSFENLRREGKPEPREIYFADYETGELTRAESVVFVPAREMPTVMNSGVICFSSHERAQAVSGQDQREFQDWIGYRTARGRPDVEIEVLLSPKSMSPESVEVKKGELVLLKISGEQLEDDVELSVEGYPELRTFTVPSTGGVVSARLWALKPGMGFPIIDIRNGRTLGRLSVAGPHTSDEEAM